MKIRWLGHSAFLLETSNGRKLLTDPYNSGSYAGTLRYGPIEATADVITVSHSHPDHDGVSSLPKPIGRVVRESKVTEEAGFRICGIDTFHDEASGSKRGRNIIFVIEAEGLRICHMGDLGHVLSESQIKEIGRIDVLLIPVGGYYTIDAKEAAQVVNQIKPRVVIPMHYKTDVLDFPVAGVDEFLKGKTNVKTLDSAFTEVTADTLPSETEIRVLKHEK
ncbi:MBL fold metallo-hydrolase [bacterium]|nr:MBL fold metallo-hydrolase [bacterium]